MTFINDTRVGKIYIKYPQKSTTINLILIFFQK